MMEHPGNYGNEMERLVECNICLGILQDPKELRCTHSYCKRCLDGVLKFNPDGSALLRCPLRCREVTKIGVDETTNDLKTPVQLKNVIDYVVEKVNREEEKSPKYNCYEHPQCNRIISLYCTECCAKSCETCMINHHHDVLDHSEIIEFLPVKFETSEMDKLLPWCDEHMTHAMYLCEEGYVCVYCKARAHSGHHSDHIDTLSEELIMWVNTQKTILPELEYMLRSSTEKSLDAVQRIRKKLKHELKTRKYTSIKKHLKKLNDSEERLLRRFDSNVSKHFASYPLPNPADYTSKRPEFEIILEKENIAERVKNITAEDVFVPEISFSLPREAISGKYPLGKLEENVGRAKIVEGEITVFGSIAETDMSRETLQTLAEDLEIMQLDIIEMEFNGAKDDLIGIEVLSPTLMGIESDANDSIEYSYEKDIHKSKMKHLFELVEANKNESLKQQLKENPNELLNLKYNNWSLFEFAVICKNFQLTKALLDAGARINQKGKYGLTALHFAARHGYLDVVKLLVQHNGDILLKTDDGKNAIDHAKRTNHQEVVEFLLMQLDKFQLKDDGKYGNMTIEEMKEEGLVIKEDFNFLGCIQRLFRN